MDLGVLNNAVMNTWSDKLRVITAAGTRNIQGVFVEAYEKSPVGNTSVERPDPSFSFYKSDYLKLGAVQGDTIQRYESGTFTNYTIVSDPQFEVGDWCNVMVREYG